MPVFLLHRVDVSPYMWCFVPLSLLIFLENSSAFAGASIFLRWSHHGRSTSKLSCSLDKEPSTSSPSSTRPALLSPQVPYGRWAPLGGALTYGAEAGHALAQSDSLNDTKAGVLGRTAFTRGEPYNVVLTHVTADFDSLAAAVGVAKLWNLQDPKTPTYVVLPRGAHPTVSKFLALHLELFPIIGVELLDPTGAVKVGMCDAQTRDRAGPGAELLDHAQAVHIFDHHVDKDSDIKSAVLRIEHVGAATTMVTELLRTYFAGASGQLSEAEATLLALGIHADTGSLTYDSSTARDAAALAWLMLEGCQQTVVSEYTHTSLSSPQQSALVEAFGSLRKRQHKGINIGSVLLASEERVAGMARVAQNLLDMSEVEVLLVGELHPSKAGRAKDRLALIGRARTRVENVDFNSLFQRFGAGGHPKAAAASVRLHSNEPEQEAEELITSLVTTMCHEQILESEPVAEDFMTAPVLSCPPDVTVAQAEEILRGHRFYAMPVLGQGDDADKLLGIITRAEIAKAFRSGEAGAPDRPVTGFMLTKVMRVSPSTPMHQIRKDMAERNTGGRAVVVDRLGRVRGLITRTDLLRQFHFYRQLRAQGHVPLHKEWVGEAVQVGEAFSDPGQCEDYRAALAGYLG